MYVQRNFLNVAWPQAATSVHIMHVHAPKRSRSSGEKSSR